MKDIFEGLEFFEKCQMEKMIIDSLVIEDLKTAYVPDDYYNIKETADSEKYLN